MPQPLKNTVEGSSAPSSPILGMPSNDGVPSLDLPEALESVQADLMEEEVLTERAIIERPMIKDSAKQDHSSLKLPNAPKGGFEAVATRSGFYGQSRLREGDTFQMAAFEDFGEWMKFLDPDIERKRVQFLKEKKTKR